MIPIYIYCNNASKIPPSITSTGRNSVPNRLHQTFHVMKTFRTEMSLYLMSIAMWSYQFPTKRSSYLSFPSFRHNLEPLLSVAIFANFSEAFNALNLSASLWIALHASDLSVAFDKRALYNNILAASFLCVWWQSSPNLTIRSGMWYLLWKRWIHTPSSQPSPGPKAATILFTHIIYIRGDVGYLQKFHIPAKLVDLLRASNNDWPHRPFIPVVLLGPANSDWPSIKQYIQ